MARQACPQQPGVALHLVQRGCQACFSGEDDRLGYLARPFSTEDGTLTATLKKRRRVMEGNSVFIDDGELTGSIELQSMLHNG